MRLPAPFAKRLRLPWPLRRRTPLEQAARAANHLARRLKPSPKAGAAKTASHKPRKAAPVRAPSRREMRARIKAARAAKGQARLDRLSFLGYVAVAAMIVAWPREGGSPVERALAGLKGDARRGGPSVAAAELALPDRGRSAEHPLQIPAKGWRDIAARVWADFGKDRIMATAGGVTFFSLLAMFPAMAAFVSLYGLFADVATVREQLRLVAGFVPHDILSFIGDELQRIAGGKSGGLGVAFVVSLLFSLWSANGAVKALFDGLNVAYEERERRSFVRLNLVSLAFTFGVLLFAVCAIAAIVAAPVALNFVQRRFHVAMGSLWWAELRWPVMLVLLAAGLSLLYRFGPSRQQARWAWLTPGSLFAAVMWLAASLAFSFYVSNFGHFNATYGSLGAVIGFMTWLWYSTIIVLVGAEVNSEIEHQTAVDTTTGPAVEMGARGANMADTLGETRDEVRARKGRPARPPQARMA